MVTNNPDDWYIVYRKRGESPANANYWAKIHCNAVNEIIERQSKLSPSSQQRIKAFVDDFIRSEYVANFTSERDSDFINEPDRAARCHDAAEYGCDGKTHAEVIEDWRDAFGYWISDRRGFIKDHDRFEQSVRDHFTLTELWHEFNGSLNQEIG